MHALKYFLLWLLDTVTIKKKKTIFIKPHRNCKSDKIDIVNYSGDSSLTFLNYIISNEHLKNYTIYVVVYEIERIKLYSKYVAERGYTNIKFVEDKSCMKSFKLPWILLRNLFIEYRCDVLMCDTVHEMRNYLSKRHKLVCFNYFSSFKSDFCEAREYSAKEYQYLAEKWALICSSSKLDSTIQSAAMGIPYANFEPLGLARNDVLFVKPKREVIEKWVYQKTGRRYSRIIIYAPTFRDYESDAIHNRSIWGCKTGSSVKDVLRELDAIVIVKMHAWQNKQIITNEQSDVLIYEPNFEFTIYDVMGIADLLITDYSSIGIDFMLTNKPLIFHQYDREKYLKSRGAAFEPFEEMCAGYIATNEAELANNIKKAIEEQNPFVDKYDRVKLFMIKYPDGCGCERIYRYLTDNKIV